MDRLKEKESIQALILGGTELPLILRNADERGIPFLDTTKIHVKRAVAQMLAEIFPPNRLGDYERLGQQGLFKLIQEMEEKAQVLQGYIEANIRLAGEAISRST